MNGSAPYDTYYVYDDLGRLRYVLPPVVDGNIAAANLALYAYRYEYDSSAVAPEVASGSR